MTTQPARTELRWLALPVFVTLVAHAVHKVQAGLAQEMLWACHVASALIGLGLLVGSISLVAVGTMFHLAMGLPAYLLDWLVSGETTATSVAAHTVPPVSGLIALRLAREWPRSVPFAAGGLFVVSALVSRLLTTPALNVNLAFAPWSPVSALGPSWSIWAMNLGLMVGLLYFADRVVRAMCRRAVRPRAEAE
jgi:hypothetical protein